ncbi:MAG: phosphoribosylanthranilate isomerase [Chloroflexi bacterium]|nr:phosphoribosylanthranilate isomerase [Chloroflexota bacterium]
MTRFKICGLRELDHALVAADSGADFIGFNFVPGVRRQVTPEHAEAVIKEFRRLRGVGPPQVVGLFANQPVDEVNRIAGQCGLDLAQLCGNEPPEYWEAVDIPVIKQIKVRDGDGSEGAAESTRREVAEVISHGHMAMLDTHREGSLGGTGKTFDWSIAAALSGAYDYLLAGGLSPENVGLAIATAMPWGVDVSSGVETDGVKDPDKIVAFANQVRLASGNHDAHS